MTTLTTLPLYAAISATGAMGIGTEAVGSAYKKPWVANAGRIMGLIPLLLLTAYGTNSMIGDILVGRAAVTANLQWWINAGVISAFAVHIVHMISLTLEKKELAEMKSGVGAIAHFHALSQLALFSLFWMGVASKMPLGLNAAEWYAKVALACVPIGIMSGLSLYSAATYRYESAVGV